MLYSAYKGNYTHTHTQARMHARMHGGLHAHTHTDRAQKSTTILCYWLS
uniref:Uncharacterized protein n=1 Tax=Anguilla anguilla TaxID=7936 RepID=A0A0E9QTX3_ANGAN